MATKNVHEPIASTPISEDTKRGTKRAKTRHPGSESSVDGDLSYLDLDTGKILAANQEENITMTKSDFDKLVTKLDNLQSKFESNDSLESCMNKLQSKFETIANLEKCMSKLNKLDKLDDIEKCVRSTNARVDKIDRRLNEVERNHVEIQKSAEFLSSEYDSLNNATKANENSIKSHANELESLFNENERLKNDLSEIRGLHKEIKSELIDSKCREMRDNLIFLNIAEDIKSNKQGRPYEDTEEVLNRFLWNNLGVSNVSFERVNRIPPTYKPGRNKPRPIVAKFTYFKDREHVRRSGYMLKGTSYGINEQFPEEIEQKRRDLYPIARHFRGQKKRVVLVRDRLFVDGEEIRAGDVELPPNDRDMRVSLSSKYHNLGTQDHPRRDFIAHRGNGERQSDSSNSQTGAFQTPGFAMGGSGDWSHRGRRTVRGYHQYGTHHGTESLDPRTELTHTRNSSIENGTIPNMTESTNL